MKYFKKLFLAETKIEILKLKKNFNTWKRLISNEKDNKSEE